MKYLLIALLLISTGAQAQQMVYKDRSGRIIGYADRYGSQTVLKNNSGQIIGYMNDYGNQTVYKNRSGEIVGYGNRYGYDPYSKQQQDPFNLFVDPFGD